MAILYSLCGPSGAGKTTLLENLKSRDISNLVVLPKSTDRAPRPSEQPGLEYNFYSRDAFLNKIFAGDFCHIEAYQDILFGIERRDIESIIYGSSNGIMQTGIYGATRLFELFPHNIRVIYMYVTHERDLMSTDCLSVATRCSAELVKRIEQKFSQRDFDEASNITEIIAARMKLNFVDMASFNGFARLSREKDPSLLAGDAATIKVLPNLRDQQEATLGRFLTY